MFKSKNIVSAFLAFLPATAFVIYIVWFLFVFAGFFNNTMQHPSAYSLNNFFISIYIIAFFMFTACTVSLIYFIVHAVNNKLLDKSERLVWIIVFLFASFVGYPIYWYMKIVKRTPEL